MTDKQLETFHGLFEKEIKKTQYISTAHGYYNALKNIVEEIDKGFDLEQIKDYCLRLISQREILIKVFMEK